jgi:hypothetical protein
MSIGSWIKATILKFGSLEYYPDLGSDPEIRIPNFEFPNKIFFGRSSFAQPIFSIIAQRRAAQAAQQVKIISAGLLVLSRPSESI